MFRAVLSKVKPIWYGRNVMMKAEIIRALLIEGAIGGAVLSLLAFCFRGSSGILQGGRCWRRCCLLRQVRILDLLTIRGRQASGY